HLNRITADVIANQLSVNIWRLDSPRVTSNNARLDVFISSSLGPFFQLIMDGNKIRIRHVGVALALTIALLVLPLLIVHGAGGRIEGKITDPKGAIVIGAAITVTDTDTNQTFTAVSDKQGQFKIDGLPAGTYTA